LNGQGVLLLWLRPTFDELKNGILGFRWWGLRQGLKRQSPQGRIGQVPRGAEATLGATASPLAPAFPTADLP